MKQRAQISGQMFIYIFSALVIVFIVIFGYSAVQKLSDKQCEAERVTFKAEIEENLKDLFGGGSITEMLRMPCETTKIIMIDVTKDVPIELFYDYPMLLNSVRDTAGDEAFLFDKDKFEVMDIDGLRLTHPFYRCFNSPTGFVELEFSRQENGVSIAPTEPGNDCTDYTMPEDAPTQTEIGMREEIFGNASSFHRAADPEAEYNESRDNFTMERRISEGDGITEIIIVITPNGNTILKDYYHFESIPKDCLYELSSIGYEFYGEEDAEVILDDPLIGWHFTEIAEETEFSYNLEIDIEEYCDPNTIQGTGFAENVETAPPVAVASEEGVIKRSLYDKAKKLNIPQNLDSDSLSKTQGIKNAITVDRDKDHKWMKSEIGTIEDLINNCESVIDAVKAEGKTNKEFSDNMKKIRNRLHNVKDKLEEE